MAREFLDNIQLNAGKPLDARYLSPSNTPYTATTQVNSLIPITQRFTGLTVNIGAVEYWYASGVTDSHLVQKSQGNIDLPSTLITGATNGLSLTGKLVTLGGTLSSQTLLFTENNGANFNILSSNLSGNSPSYSISSFADNSNTGFIDESSVTIRSNSDRTNTVHSSTLNLYSTTDGITKSSISFSTTANPGESMSIGLDSTDTLGIKVTDSINSKGLYYASNYSSNFGKYSLVDKNYVTGLTSNILYLPNITSYLGATGVATSITGATSIDRIPTTSLSIGKRISAIVTIGGTERRLYTAELVTPTNTTANIEVSPSVVRPNDFNATTNNKVWREIKNSGIIDVSNYGVVPDPTVFVSDQINALISAASSGSTLIFPPGTYKVYSITVNKALNFIGLGATLSLAPMDVGMLSVLVDSVTIKGFKFVGQGRTSTLYPNQKGITIQGCSNILISDCTFDNFADAAIRTNTSHQSDVSGDYGGINIVNCIMMRSGCGFYASTRGEYAQIVGCSIVNCDTGTTIGAGNINFTGTQILDCNLGVHLISGVNDSHGIFSGCQINHNVKSIVASGIQNGHFFRGCNIYFGNMEFTSCLGVTFDNCTIAALESKWDNCTGGTVQNCVIDDRNGATTLNTNWNNPSTVYSSNNKDLNGVFLQGWNENVYELYVDDYGAVGDGVSNDSAAIQRAITAAGTQGTIYFTKGKTYIIDETVELPVALGMVGYGAIIKRKDAIATTTTQSFLANATTITVSSTTGFKVGDPIILCDVTLPYGGRGYEENSATSAAKSAAHLITSISGNTFTLSTGIRIAMPSGSTVVKVYDMFNGAASTVETSAQGNRILGIEFDGNVTNNNHTNSWVFNKTIDNLPMNSLVQDCTFHDIPSENIFVSNNATVMNNRAYNLNGSFVHVSQATSPNTGYNNFVGNKLKNICLATNDVTDHSEGAFTMSADPQKIFCSDNYVENCSGSFFSPISDLSKGVTIINNKAYNCDGVVTFYNFTGVAEKTIISNNLFENCGWLQVQANQGAANDDFVEVGRGHDHYNITDNIFVNVKFRLQRASQFSIKNNEFITTTGHTYSTTDEVSDRDATISLTRCTQYTIEGNSFDNRAVALDAKLHAAINCEYNFNLNLALAQPIKSDASTNTEYCYYNRYVKISNNKVHNYRFGIMDYYPFSEILPARSLSWIGFEISNNMINLRPSGAYAIVAGPGSIVHNNKIYSTSATIAPLRLLGVNNGSGTTYNTGGTQRLRLNGAIAYHNTVIGSTKSIEVGSVSTTYGNNVYNCQVINNFVDGTVVDNTAGASTISGTITLVNESLILQNIRQNPEFY